MFRFVSFRLNVQTSWITQESEMTRAKNERIKELQRQLAQSRQMYADVRLKACMQHGIAESYIQEVNDMKKEFVLLSSFFFLPLFFG